MNTINWRYSSVPYFLLYRDELEAAATKAVCACWYCDLVDALEEMPDTDLVRIIEREPCIACE